MESTEKRKTVLCKNWSQTGACKFGDRCNFAHGQQDLKSQAKPPVNPNLLHPCIRVYGKCNFGDRCRFAAEPRHKCLRCIKKEPSHDCDTHIDRTPTSPSQSTPTKPVEAWSEEDVVKWLDGLGFSEISKNFKTAKINGEMLQRLRLFDERIVETELGITGLKKTRLLHEIQKLKRPSGQDEPSGSFGHRMGSQKTSGKAPQINPFTGSEAMLRWIKQRKDDFEDDPIDAMHKLSTSEGLQKWRAVASCEQPSSVLFSSVVELISGLLDNELNVTWAQDCGQLLSAFLGSSFFVMDAVALYVKGGSTLLFGSSADKKFVRINKILKVFDALLRRFSAASNELPVDKLEDVIEEMCGEDPCPEPTGSLLAAVKGRWQDGLRQLQRQRTQQSSKASTTSTTGEAVITTYRDTTVFPSSEEIREPAPFLKKNVVDQPLTNFEFHLDIHFHLLREDCLGSLRVGIQNHLQGMSSRENRDFKIYRDVHIVGISSTAQGIVYRVRFSAAKYIQWHRSKRLQVGSLVCLSSQKDNFHGELMWATIARRTLEELNQQMICLRFPNVVEQGFQIGQIYCMAETSVYFEAYQHVLHGLQRIELTEFPFQKYFMGTCIDIDPPKYLKRPPPIKEHEPPIDGDSPVGLDKYDFSALAKPDEESDTNSDNDDDLVERDRLGFKNRFSWEVLGKWPEKNELQLDDTQLQALKLCLSKELAIVQGPPGTGKTFLGIQVVRLLLQNPEPRFPKDSDPDIWFHRDDFDSDSDDGFRLKGVQLRGPDEMRRGPAPILIVCYTNHALDQFLEGILKYESKVVRIGGRCSEKLDQYNLWKLNAKWFQRKFFPAKSAESV